MGLLDDLIAKASKGVLNKVIGGMTGSGHSTQNQQDNIHTGLLSHVMDMLKNQGTGGLGGLLAKLKGGGGNMSKAVDSWVGTGPNQPVSADQVSSALGQDQISQLAQKFGIPESMVSSHLAQILPELINHVTPNGQVPDQGAVSSALDALKGKLFGH